MFKILDLEKRGNTHNFTPRLGRMLDDDRSGDNLIDTAEKYVPVSPQFGRSLHFGAYSPRLGRDEPIAYI